MHVAHNLAWYFPDSSGGTEVYVESLVRSLEERGVRGSVIAATTGDRYANYCHGGIQVHRYPVTSDHRQEVIQGTDAHAGFDVFKRALCQVKPDLFHLHSWTPDSGLHHLRYAKSMGLPTVLTIHTASVLCMRGTMIRNGERVCDGEINLRLCTECVANARGASAAVCRALSCVPDRISRFSKHRFNHFRAGNAIAMRSIVDSHRQKLGEAGRLADKIIVLSQWLYDSLLLNRVEEHKLVLCRHGVSHEFEPAAAEEKNKAAGSIRMGMIGRADPAKGMHTVIAGFRQLKHNAPLQLDIHAMAPDASSQRHLKKLKHLADGDCRIHFCPAIKRGDLPQVMKNFDLLLVPSECLETGPLVVLEALALKVPVFGSGIGGIKEYIQDGENGRLLHQGDEYAWGRAFAGLVESPEKVSVYRKNIQKVKTMHDVARETQKIYEEL